MWAVVNGISCLVVRISYFVSRVLQFGSLCVFPVSQEVFFHEIRTTRYEILLYSPLPHNFPFQLQHDSGSMEHILLNLFNQ